MKRLLKICLGGILLPVLMIIVIYCFVLTFGLIGSFVVWDISVLSNFLEFPHNFAMINLDVFRGWLLCLVIAGMILADKDVIYFEDI